MGSVLDRQAPYAETHPWLKFEVDLRAARPQFWMSLGEARSKCEHIQYVPLEESTARDLHNMYFARGLLATTAIEGNTLSLDEVKQRMEGRLDLPTSKEYLGVEIDNMLRAYNGIIDSYANHRPLGFSVEQLKAWNREILAGLDVEEGVVPGEVRQHRVAVGTYLAPEWFHVEELLARLCDWLNGPSFTSPDDTQRIPYAFIKAVVAHVYIEWIHPFGDGNGRLGRLAEFMILVGSGVPTPAAHLLSQHYMDTRSAYYRQLSRASKGGSGDLIPFLEYAAQGWADGLRDQIKRLHAQQEILMWRAIVDEAFHDKKTPASHRQRILATELGQRKIVKVKDLRALTQPIAACYQGKTMKTVSRDLTRLTELALVRRVGSGAVRARIERVRGMRPFKVDHDTPGVTA